MVASTLDSRILTFLSPDFVATARSDGRTGMVHRMWPNDDSVDSGDTLRERR